VVELFTFLEMRNSASRIEILTFEGTTPYTNAGFPRMRAHSFEFSHLPRVRTTPDAELAATGGARVDNGMQRFAVQHATCATAEDADKLLSVIEMCGSGFDSFNNWMHELLIECSQSDRHQYSRDE
jgi:hypothetical protein